MATHTVRSILIAGAAVILVVLPLSPVHAMGKTGVELKSAGTEGPVLRTQGARGSVARAQPGATTQEVESLRRQIAELQMKLASVKGQTPAE